MTRKKNQLVKIILLKFFLIMITQGSAYYKLTIPNRPKSHLEEKVNSNIVSKLWLEELHYDPAVWDHCFFVLLLLSRAVFSYLNINLFFIFLLLFELTKQGNIKIKKKWKKKTAAAAYQSGFALVNGWKASIVFHTRG